MKIQLIQSDIPCETEVILRCSRNPDAKTEELLRFLNNASSAIIGCKDGNTHRISLQDVMYIDSVDEKTFLYLDREVYESMEKLYEWEAQLENTSFVRISKSTILNTDMLKSVRPLLGGKMEAYLVNGEKQIINRHYIPEFKRKFGIGKR